MIEKTSNTRRRMMTVAIALMLVLSMVTPAFADEVYVNAGEAESVFEGDDDNENIGYVYEENGYISSGDDIITESNADSIENIVPEEPIVEEPVVKVPELEIPAIEAPTVVESVVAFTVANVAPLSTVVDDMTVSVEGNPAAFIAGEVYTFILTHYPGHIDLGELRILWELLDGHGVSFHGGERNGNVLRQQISFRRTGTWNLSVWVEDNRESTLQQV